MKTNINIDNYEAYLLDYMEGNLSPDEAEQLKAFVAAQGLDWDELTEELPNLEALQMVYEDKERLKKKDVLVPLYVKIASAAAAAGLLLTVTLWPDKSMNKTEPVAELKLILPTRLITSEESQMLPPRTISFATSQTKAKKHPQSVRSEAEMLSDLQPIMAKGTPIALTATHTDEPDFDLITHQLYSNLAFAQFDGNDIIDDLEEERNLSLIGKGIYRLTNGNHDSFASLFSSGLSTAKKEFSLAATDMALSAYNRADERLEGAKERWQEKHGE